MSGAQRVLSTRHEVFALSRVFTISRGSRTHAEVLTADIADPETGLQGRGECVPYGRYGETLESVDRQITSVRAAIGDGASRTDLLDLLPAGAARNAVDAALWDLELKTARVVGGTSPWPFPVAPVRTVRTLSLAAPEAMAAEATEVADRFASLKLKLGGEPGELDIERVAAVKDAAPDCDLLVDANESWAPEDAERRIGQLAELSVVLVEQPVAVADDHILGTFEHRILLCADESFHTSSELDRVASLYDVVNLKLDKTGGLSHALEARRRAEDLGLAVMVGCMVGTSLAMAPALLLAQGVDLIDLDGPYLLAEDRPEPLGLSEQGWISPNPACWG